MYRERERERERREGGVGGLSIKMPSYQYGVIPMLKIRRSHDRHMFNMGIPIPGKTVFILRWNTGSQLSCFMHFAACVTVQLFDVSIFVANLAAQHICIMHFVSFHK